MDIPVDVQGFAPPEEFASFLESAEELSKEASVKNAETDEDDIPIMEYWRRQAVTSKPKQKGRYAIVVPDAYGTFETPEVFISLTGKVLKKKSTVAATTVRSRRIRKQKEVYDV